jgi:transcriptional regulator with XRE-family HTH domain
MPRGGPRLRTPDRKLNQVGPRVAERRQALQLEQDEVCARLALRTDGEWNPGWQDLSRIENGARMVSDLEILVLAQALECSACWLLAGEG